MLILYRDSHYTVAYKEAGMLSEHTGARERSLPHQLADALAMKALPHPVHRLDKEVSGANLFAIDAEAMARISSKDALCTLEKTYIAVCTVPLPQREGEMQDLLFHDRQKNKSYTVKRKRAGVREGRLSYRLLTVVPHPESKEKELCFYAVTPHTGRTHQIRVQFAARGCPLVGDMRYGAREKAPHIGLLCRRICFVHPYTAQTVTVDAPLPDFFPFTAVKEDALM